jgi:hypothetical protein
MSRSLWIAAVALFVLVVAGLSLRESWESPTAAPALMPDKAAASPAGNAALTPEQRKKILQGNEEARLADGLNSPGSTLQEDLAKVGSMLAAYRSVYAGRGNPIGDNREIVETLLGRNPNGVIFLAANHPAINARGELCDRWGSPFLFHAESGTKMEIRSAGPDRIPWNADDVSIVP